MKTRIEPVIYIGHLAFNTENMGHAMQVAERILNPPRKTVRGRVKIGNRYIRWSTIQQYEYHGSFILKRKTIGEAAR